MRLEFSFRDYLRLQNPETHSFYISFMNRVKSILSGTSSSRPLWHFAKNVNSYFASSSFPPLVSPDGTTAVLTSSKAELFAQTFASNSTLDDSELFLLLQLPSTHLCLKL
ncbi:UNVERIFIED_CONTAM: hypothetical protein RMT77_004531 [Armadillidium vulgare]